MWHVCSVVKTVGKVPAKGTPLAENLLLPQPQGCPVRQRVVKGHGWCFMSVLQECTALGRRSVTNHRIICIGRNPQEWSGAFPICLQPCWSHQLLLPVQQGQVHQKCPLWTPSMAGDVLAWQFPEFHSRQRGEAFGLELAARDVFTGLCRHRRYCEMSKQFSLLHIHSHKIINN